MLQEEFKPTEIILSIKNGQIEPFTREGIELSWYFHIQDTVLENDFQITFYNFKKYDEIHGTDHAKRYRYNWSPSIIVFYPDNMVDYDDPDVDDSNPPIAMEFSFNENRFTFRNQKLEIISKEIFLRNHPEIIEACYTFLNNLKWVGCITNPITEHLSKELQTSN